MSPDIPEASPELFDELETEVDADELSGEIIIIGAEECLNCGAVKKLFEEELADGSVRYVDIESEEGQKIDALFDRIDAVPFVTYHDMATHRYTACSLAPDGNDMETAAWTIACDVRDVEKSRTMPAEQLP